MVHLEPLAKRPIALSPSQAAHDRCDAPSSPDAPGAHWSRGTLAALAIAALCVVGAGPKSPSEVQWLTNLAANGSSGAQLQLGLAYRAGALGLAPDREASRHWLRMSAEGGNAYAAETLQAGRHTPNDGAVRGATLDGLATRFHSLTLRTLSIAADLISRVSLAPQSATALRQSAEAGDPIAQYQLGIRYRDGSWGVERDTVKARSWLVRAADSGNSLAAQALLTVSH
jgi:TPR repeat protein